MKIIVLSKSKWFDGEEQIVTEMFKQGLQYFHLRKANLSKVDMVAYLNAIPEKYHNRIILHSKHNLARSFNVKGIHLTRKHQKKTFKNWWHMKWVKAANPNIRITASFHSLESLIDSAAKFDYVFLSPVFDSISKNNYPGKFNDSNLDVVFGNLKTKVVALGGVDVSKIEWISNMRFDGIGLLGAIWKSDDPVSQYINIKMECERRNLSLV